MTSERLSTEVEVVDTGDTMYEAADDVDVVPFSTSNVCNSSADVVVMGGEVNWVNVEGNGGDPEENPLPLDVEKSQLPDEEGVWPR